MARRLERLAKEPFCRTAIALGGEQEVDCLTGGVHRPIQIFLLAADLYIRLVNPIGLVGWPEIGAAALVQFRCIHLNPAEHAGMVRGQSAFSHHLGHVSIAEWKIQVPTYATKDDFRFILSPVERVLRGDRHGLSFYRAA